MTISTYGTLKTAIADWLARSDLTSYIPDFINNAHSRIHYGSGGQYQSSPLRIRAMETATDLTVSSQTVALPTRYLQTRRLYLNSNPTIPVKYFSPQGFWDEFVFSTTGKPYGYTIEAENFVFGPPPDATYTGKLLYYQKFADLSSDSDTNWLLTNAPTVYLYASLLEAAPFLANDDRLPTWFALFQSAIQGVMMSDNLDRHSGPVSMKSDIYTDGGVR